LRDTPNKALARAFLQAITDGDVSALGTIMSKDIVIDAKGSSVVSAKRGFDEFIDLAAGLKETLEDGLHFDVTSVIGEGDLIVCEAVGKSKLKDGLRYDNEYVFIMRISGGKVSEVHEYFDTVLADKTIGPLLAGGQVTD